MSKRCRRSILCRARRGRCCLRGAVFVVLHFRRLIIALSSTKVLRGVSINSRRLYPNPVLHLSSRKAEHQTHRCCAASFSSPQNLHSADSCLPTSARQMPRAVWWLNLNKESFTLSSRDSSLSSPPLHLLHPRLPAPHHSLLLHTSSSSRFLVRSLVSSEDIVSRDPQKLHGPAMLSQCPQDAPQLPQSSLLARSLLRSYKGFTVGDQSYATNIRPWAQLVSSLLHHHTSASLRLLPGHGAIRLYHQPATSPSLLQCSLRYLSLMCFRIRFLGSGIEGITGKAALPRLHQYIG